MNTATVENKVKQIVSNIRNFPTPPIVFQQIQKVINDPDCTAAKVAAILSEDPAMSVKVLKLTNSAFYGLARSIDSIKQAVMIVGNEAIQNLVLSTSVLNMFKGKGKDSDKEFQESFWRHSVATAYCSRILAKNVRSRGVVDPDSAFSAGLLHDIGKMVIFSFLKEKQAILDDARVVDATSLDYELEDKVLGFNHAQIGGYLVKQWKLSKKLSDSIIFHHFPQQAESEDPLMYLVYLANYVAKKTFYEEDETYKIGTLDNNVVDFMQLTMGDFDKFSETLKEEYFKAETFMQMVGMS